MEEEEEGMIAAEEDPSGERREEDQNSNDSINNKTHGYNEMDNQEGFNDAIHILKEYGSNDERENEDEIG